ncbi:hypothetical protein BJ170DRAFT_684143 [Xylariales sp. AK1849]|nr:hypothetical protein BJ170DRAFT_684143 [Xylariales sp. AK1849]
MSAEHIDLTTIMSDESDNVDNVRQTPNPNRQGPSQPHSQPGSRPRRPISPPALGRQATASMQGDPAPVATASPSRGNRGSAQRSAKDEVKMPALALRTTGNGPKNSQGITSPSQGTQQHASTQRTPKNYTPKKVEWNTDKVEQSLRKLALGIGTNGASLSARLLHLSWKKCVAEPRSLAKKNWFADMKRTPAEGSKDMIKIKTKHMGPGRSGKQEKREYYHVIGIKTNRLPAPKYSFHHVEISKNILSPNTMLNFVPHLRDLADEEEPKYRRWLENLESMDKTSGFATLSRQEKVHKTCQKEKATILLLYLDTWLEKLSIENCSRHTLIRHMASQNDAATPQQNSRILNSYNDDGGSPKSVKAVRMFTEAFDRVFNAADIWKEGAVTLRDVLLLDKSVDTIVDSKKWMKDTPSQVKPVEENTTVESFLETYAFLGCLICCSHSCEHGEYGVDNERKRFSIEVVGGLEPMLRKMAIQAKSANGGESSAVHKPCGEDCYLKGQKNTRSRGWSETEVMLLRSFLATLSDTSIPVQCATAVATGRYCWDVNRQLNKLDISPSLSSPPLPVKVKPVPWYDRHKKVLLGDWQEHTITHEHQRKDHFDPCHHEGPCTLSNCECVKAGVMCERFCRCTVDTCATKFNGCACHSLGKTCVPKQKERPCICIQLNRECDPALCGSCGALDRANPRNADDDQLYTHGCQNCPLQRGKSKSLVLGKSMIENCGYGLFTTEDIAQDEFVIEYVGELISQDEGVRREARRGDVFNEESNSSYLFTLLEQEGIWVDAAIYGNLSRYINHQDDADKRGLGCNITPKILYVGGEYRIKFSSMRDIKAGEELFFNYGENFPNLTKKLLDEQKEEEKVNKRRARKEKADSDRGVGRPRKAGGATKGKKRGRKPKKKAFAAKVDSDPEDDDEDDDDIVEDIAEEEDPFPDIVPEPRKRKRAHVDSDSDEEEYRPEIADSDAQSVTLERPASRGKPRNRKPLRKGDTMRKAGRGLFDGVSRNGSEADTDEAGQNHTPKRRGRKARKFNEPHIDGVGEDDILTRGGVRRSGGSARNPQSRRHADSLDSNSEVDYTPSRPRTRRQQVKDAVDSSPLSALDAAFDDDLEVGTFELERNIPTQGSEKPKKKRGRPRKVVLPREEIEETSDYGDAADGPVTPGGSNRKQLGIPAADSDASSNNVIDRSRVRRKPARYSD